MKNLTPSVIESFLKRNWFQIGLAAIVLIAFVQKDISIEFSFDNDQLDNSALLATHKATSNKSKSAKQKMGFDIFNSDKESHISKPKAVKVKAVERPTNVSPKAVSFKGSEKLIASITNKNQAFEFIDRFGDVAASEAKKFDLEKAVILGLGLYHASSPKTALAIKANNYFAMPCTPDWQGESISYNDACYRTYESAWFSFRDQSKYLSLLQKNMNRGEKMSISQWANVLKKNGLISSQHRFLQLVESFRL